MRIRHLSRVGWRAMRLRCPACGHGKLYSQGLHLEPTCPYCQSRYERDPGESIGAVYLVSGLSVVVVVVAFWLFSAILDIESPLFLALVLLGLVVTNVLFYRLARALWIALVHMTGGVHPDSDVEREYYAPPETSTSYERW